MEKTPSYPPIFPFLPARVERRAVRGVMSHLPSPPFPPARVERRAARGATLCQPPSPSPSPALPLRGIVKRMSRTPLSHLLSRFQTPLLLRELMGREAKSLRVATRKTGSVCTSFHVVPKLQCWAFSRNTLAAFFVVPRFTGLISI